MQLDALQLHVLTAPGIEKQMLRISDKVPTEP